MGEDLLLHITGGGHFFIPPLKEEEGREGGWGICMMTSQKQADLFCTELEEMKSRYIKYDMHGTWATE